MQELCSSESNEIIKDEIALAILLELGMKERIAFPELVKTLSVDEDILKSKLSLLEEKEYIGQNPSSILEKPFKDRKYMLRIRGIFLLNKIRYEFPDCAMYFKFFF